MGGFSKELQSVVSPKFDENVLLEVLQKIFQLNSVKIKDIQFKYDSKKGDSFLSMVSRFRVEAIGYERDGKEKAITLPVISKALPSNIGRRKTFRSLEFFNNEVIFYNTTWKAMNEFQLSKSSIPVFGEIPMCISALADGINDYVTLEDLSFKGYDSVPRCDGLDLEHTKLVINLFAKFHALGLAFKDQQFELFEKVANSLEETYFSEKQRGWYSNFMTKNLFKTVRDAIQKQLPDSYLIKLDGLFKTDLFGAAINCCAERGRFAVITHGDAWAPNFLMKYNSENKPQSAFMIDFQLARYASLALDLLFFLYTCTDQSLRTAHWDHIIKYYHETFVATLEKLGSSGNLLTLDDLQKELKKYGIFGLVMSMEAICMSLADDDAFDLESIQDESSTLESVWVLHPFEEEEKRQRIADMFKNMVDVGYI